METNDITETLFEEFYKQWKGEDRNSILIPRNILTSETLPLKLKEEARTSLLETKSKELLDTTELEAIWEVLLKYESPPAVQNEQFISYEKFKLASLEVPEKAKHYFTATTYAKLVLGDVLTRLSINEFFNYIVKKDWLKQTRIGISVYDEYGEGSLREPELENYIADLMPSFSQLNKLDDNFKTYYICTAVRKFFFFLDPLRTGRVKITDVLASGFFDQMLELRDQTNIFNQNWFSPDHAIQLYNNFLKLDVDKNGMLTKAELSKFGSGTLTDVFMDRIFQEFPTYCGEVDYRSYLDFVLAMDNKSEPQAISYFFRCFDINGNGKITVMALNYFFQGIRKKMRELDGREIQSFKDIQDEIFDMINPTNPNFITLDDLIKCGKSEIIINILIDLRSFLVHENREAFSQNVPEEAEL